MKNSKVQALFQGRILWVEFLDHAVVTEKDLEEVYSLAESKAKGKKYCVMFELHGHYDVTEGGMEYLLKNPHNKNVLEKIFLVNTKDAETKTKVLFGAADPESTLQTFKSSREGLDFLKEVLAESKN